MSPGPRVHGTLPLAKAEDGSLRFWSPDDQEPGTPVLVPGDLPDAELTLRVFPDAAMRAGYVAALKEHGGNAIDTVLGPPAFTPPILLVVRHDRPRVHADGLDGAIALSGAPPGLADDYSRTISFRASSREQRERGERNRKAWEPVSRVAGKHGAFLIKVEDGHVEFLPRNSRRILRVTRTDAGYRLGWDPILSRLPEELDAQWRKALADLGLSFAGAELGFHVDADAFDESSVSRFVEVQGEVEGVRERLDGILRRREIVEGFRKNPSVARIFSRMAHGAPILWSRGSPAAQMSERSLRPQSTAGTLVAELLGRGLLDVLWEAGPGVGSGLSILWHSPAGKAFAEGRYEDAVEGVLTHGRHGARPTGDLAGAIDSIRDDLTEDALETLARTLPDAMKGYPDEGRFPGSLDYGRWGALIHGALVGGIDLDEGARCYSTAAPAVRNVP